MPSCIVNSVKIEYEPKIGRACFSESVDWLEMLAEEPFPKIVMLPNKSGSAREAGVEHPLG